MVDLGSSNTNFKGKNGALLLQSAFQLGAPMDIGTFGFTILSETYVESQEF